MTTAATGPGPASAAHRWLRGAPADRARFLDMGQRFRRPWVFGLAITIAKLFSAVWYGPVVLVLLGVGAVTMVVAVLSRRHGRDETDAAVAFALLELNLAVTVLLTGGGSSALLPLLAVPVFSQAVLFRPQVFLTGCGVAAALAGAAVALAGLLPDAPAVPPVVHLVVYLTLLTCLGSAGLFLASSDLHARDEAVIDPMTGLFNRLTLSARFLEAQQTAAATGGSVGLVMCDVDHFKTINDLHGHDRGDQVLGELADRFRANLRATDVAYRVGGEEFVVLLPGRDAAAAQRVAERIRGSVAESPLAGLPVTLSAGVVSAHGAQGTLAELLRQADAALYTAKNTGRNQVVVASGVTHVTRPAIEPMATT